MTIFLCMGVENGITAPFPAAPFVQSRIVRFVVLEQNLKRTKAHDRYIQSRCIPSIASHSLPKRMRRCNELGSYVKEQNSRHCWSRIRGFVIRMWWHSELYNHSFQPNHATDANSNADPNSYPDTN